MAICKLYIVRHGETQWNLDKIVQGHTNIPLNVKGEMQAHERKEDLRNVDFDYVYSSDLIRAHRTVEIIALERNLAITTTEALRERNFGLREGKPMDEKHKVLCELLAKYTQHPVIEESKAETNDLIVSRVFTFLREISVAHPAKKILVGSHGGVLRQILIHLGFATEAQLPSGSVQNLAYVKLESDGVDFKVKDTSGIILSK